MNDLLLLLVAAVFFGERGLKHHHTDHIKLFSVLVKLKLRAFKQGGDTHLLTFCYFSFQILYLKLVVLYQSGAFYFCSTVRSLFCL